CWVGVGGLCWGWGCCWFFGGGCWGWWWWWVGVVGGWLVVGWVGLLGWWLVGCLLVLCGLLLWLVSWWCLV
ncbi:hypothetical protein RA269_27570, partial [Pseudomonas syringae pv. tagetis]|uniref:hypothetical protein n=1 Tax=Pseudomonas syringae group genomosp. 7 TaxID=251699 RepID=UPI00377010E4